MTMIARLEMGPTRQTRGLGWHTGAPRLADIRKLLFTRGAVLLALAVLIAAGAPSRAAFAEAPARFMQRVANELIAAQRSGGEAAFAKVIRRYADVPTIGLASLGTYRPRLRKQDRSSYYKGIVRFISRYAAKESGKYPVARAVVIGQNGGTQHGIYVDSTVTLAGGSSYDVRWFLIRRNSGWKVRDAEVVGLWVSPFLKNLFENFLAQNGGNPRVLIATLNQ
ncbi:MAG: ABC transporter substrate-binding protein [Pseudomonadota bacterium]